MTHSWVFPREQHDPFVCVTWRIGNCMHVSVMTYSFIAHCCAGHGTFMCVTWHIHVYGTILCVWHYSVVSDWRIHVCDITAWRIHVVDITAGLIVTPLCMTWRIHVCDLTVWRIQVVDMSLDKLTSLKLADHTCMRSAYIYVYIHIDMYEYI